MATKKTAPKPKTKEQLARSAAYVKGGVVPSRQKTKDGKPRTRPTGFKEGNPGRPKGAKDKGGIPRNVKASMRQLFEDVVTRNKGTLRTALMRGVTSGPRHADRYLKLITEYVDGKPVDTLNLNTQFDKESLDAASSMLGKKMEAMVAALQRKKAD